MASLATVGRTASTRKIGNAGGDAYWTAFAARGPFEVEYRLRRSNGEYGSIICVGRPYHDMKGDFCGYLCSCYDNSARRAIEGALRGK